jgi:hypothetical protein
LLKLFGSQFGLALRLQVGFLRRAKIGFSRLKLLDQFRVNRLLGNGLFELVG